MINSWICFRLGNKGVNQDPIFEKKHEIIIHTDDEKEEEPIGEDPIQV